MRRTQQSSIEALEKAIEEQKNTRDFNYINDLKMLRKQYTCRASSVRTNVSDNRTSPLRRCGPPSMHGGIHT